LIQTAIAAALAVLIHVFYVLPLWNQKYMEQIMQQWHKPLIVDVMVIDENSGDNCPKGYNAVTTSFPGI